MSVILEALNKARREKLPLDYGQHDLLGQVPESVKPRSHALRKALWILCIMAVLACIAGMSWFVLRGDGANWLATRLHAATAAPQPRDDVAVAGDAAKAAKVGAQMVATAAALQNGEPRKAEVHFSDGTVVQFSGPALAPGEFAIPPARIASADELPPPVPLNALGPEADRSLPPAPAATPAKAPYIVSAILWDEKQSMAIVNGQTVLEGRKYGTFRVLQITPDKVVIQPEGGEPIALSQR